MNKIITTTADLKADYEVIGPIYFQVSNKGFFTSKLTKLVKKYMAEAETLEEDPHNQWKKRFGELSLDANKRYEKAFYVAVRELQETAKKLGADGIIGLRHNLTLDDGFELFHLQMYGTAIKLK